MELGNGEDIVKGNQYLCQKYIKSPKFLKSGIIINTLLLFLKKVFVFFLQITRKLFRINFQ